VRDRHTRMGTCVRWGMAAAYGHYKFMTVSLLKRPRNGRFTSETAVRRPQNQIGHLEVVIKVRWDF
jgi:hypothetical protein